MVTTTCLLYGILSAFLGDIFLIRFCPYLRYPNSFEIAEFSTRLLQAKKIYLSYFSQISIICCTREIHEENIAIIILHLLVPEIILSRVSPISFSLFENHFFVEPVESDIKRVTPSFPSSASLSRSNGLSSAGVKSILKSPVWTIFAPPGVRIHSPAQSGTEWFTRKN